MEIFRAVPRDTFVEGRIIQWRASTRLPGNVPYVVDNLWEYVRPQDLPSRRHAVYASPSAELALAGASSQSVPADRFIACRVVIAKPTKLFQASVSDARLHPDVGAIPRLVNRYVQNPTSAPLDLTCLAPLFLPGTPRDQLHRATQEVEELARLIDQVAGEVKMWQDKPDPTAGEIIFEIAEGNSYQLTSV